MANDPTFLANSLRSPLRILPLVLLMAGPPGCGEAQLGAGGPTPSPAAQAASLQGYVNTPFGLYHASCVYDVGDGASVDADGTVERADGSRFQLPECQYLRYSSVVTPAETNGWVEDADWTSSTWVRELTSDMDVPTAPSANDGQTVYFFSGVEPTAGEEILQPVLAYRGSSGLWTMESWYCGPSCAHSTMVTVQPGQTLAGSVLGSNCTSGGVCAKWTITTKNTSTGKSTTINRKNDPYVFQWSFGGVLEAYDIVSCADYPASQQISFTDIDFYDQNLDPLTPAWKVETMGQSPSCGFKGTQSTHAVTLNY